MSLVWTPWYPGFVFSLLGAHHPLEMNSRNYVSTLDMYVLKKLKSPLRTAVAYPFFITVRFSKFFFNKNLKRKK